MFARARACVERPKQDPGSGITPPAGWQAMPALATAASDARKPMALSSSGAEAWGEPARGCFGAWLGLRAGARAPDAMVDALVKSLAAEKIEVRDIVKPAAGAAAGTVSLRVRASAVSRQAPRSARQGWAHDAARVLLE